jgi:hypothetical protein
MLNGEVHKNYDVLTIIWTTAHFKGVRGGAVG